MTVPLVDLNLKWFVAKLTHCESSNILSDWEKGFVADMRERFNSREDAEDLGAPVWNPTASQFNTLNEIAERSGYRG